MAANKSRLWVELIVLFIGLPLMVAVDWVPIVPPVFILFIAAAYALFICRAYLKAWDAKPKFNWQRDKVVLRSISWRGLLLMLLILAFVYRVYPDRLFSLPKSQPYLIFLIAVFYPLVSVVPQEFLYRSFFFHRYRTILSKPWLMIAASAILFSFLHVVYGNWIAILLSLGGGLLFSYTYHQTRSLLMVTLEHYLYGMWIFVVGLGEFFYMNMFST